MKTIYLDTNSDLVDFVFKFIKGCLALSEIISLRLGVGHVKELECGVRKVETGMVYGT